MENKFLIPRTIFIGGNGNTERIAVGGTNPITIQTMWKEQIADVNDNKAHLEKICSEIARLKLLGCDIIRFAVPDKKSAQGFVKLCASTTMPLVADIHFDYTLALECLKGNVGAIRINPGNIGSIDKVKKVVEACAQKGVAIRIGVNSGSLPKDLECALESQKISMAEALCKAASREAEVFTSLNFDQFAVSMKSSSVDETIEANELFASKYDIPLHIGVTEAGPLVLGIVKSTLAFSHLLKQGIGSTIRVSLSSSPENEVIAALSILKECKKRTNGVTLISCPRCGREGFDVLKFMEKWQTKLLSLNKNITIAVMGCIVNGPGEAQHADIGIAGAGENAIIFKKGKIIRTINQKDADKVFEEELKSL